MNKEDGYYSVAYKVNNIDEAERAVKECRRIMWSPYTTYCFIVNDENTYICGDVMFSRDADIELHNATLERVMAEAQDHFLKK